MHIIDQALIINISQQNYYAIAKSLSIVPYRILLPFTPFFTVLYICEIIVK